MALTYNEYTGDGNQMDFVITFPYLAPDHVKVYVENVLTAYTWINSSTIRILPQPTGAIIIRRETPYIDRMVEFQNGALLNEDDLNLQTKQLFYALQEIRDDQLLTLGGTQGAKGDPGTPGLDGAPGADGTWDQNIPALLNDLTGQITEDQLYLALTRRLDYLDANGFVYGATEPGILQSQLQAQSETDNRLSGAEISIDGLNAEIILKAWQVDLDDLGNVVTSDVAEMTLAKNQWTVKIQQDSQSDFVIGGVGLLLDPYSSKSTFMILADQFKVVNPSLATDKKQVFTVGTIDGVGGMVGIHGNLVIDGTVIARHIAADAIEANHIGANVIQAGHLLVRPYGRTINLDPDLLDESTWSATGVTFPTVSDGKVGSKTMRNTTDAYNQVNDNKYYPVDPNKAYRLSFWARASGTEGTHGVLYSCLRQFKYDLSFCDTNLGRSPYKPCAGQAPHTGWVYYEGVYRGADWQTGVKYVQVDFLLNYNAGGGNTGWWEVQHIRMEECVEGELIVDGYIKNSGFTAPSDSTTPGSGMRLDVTNGKIEAYGNDHALGGNLVVSNGSYMVSLGRYLTAAGLGKQYPLHNSTNFTEDGRTHGYKWNGSAWVELYSLGYDSTYLSYILAKTTDSTIAAICGISSVSAGRGLYGLGFVAGAVGVYGRGYSTDSIGVHGYADGGGYGGVFETNSGSGKAPLRIVPGSSGDPSHTAAVGSLWVTNAGVLWINTSGSTTWQKVGAQ